MRIIYLLTLLLLAGCSNSKEYIFNEGFVFGTTYKIIYKSTAGDLHDEIKAVLASVSHSLSTFDSTSIISRFNRGEANVTVDSFFTDVFAKAKEVHSKSGGTFDITIAPIANAWGFGFEKRKDVTSEMIDSLMQFVGMDNVFIEDGVIRRKKAGVMLNVSAIAKGYGVDVVTDFLKKNGIHNYMVEIGGEIAMAGVNPKQKLWHIGIDKPVDNPAAENREVKFVLQLSDKAIATSGNYRNFYVKEGKKLAHTIDPRTGYPVQMSVLSATIIANDCMTADAYATVCMVIGLDDAMKLIERIPCMDGCFIYEITESGIQGMAYTEGFDKYVKSML